MPRNTLMDLNNLLFEQMERLNDEELTPEQLNVEMQRTKVMADMGKTIVANANLMLDAKKHMDEYGVESEVPEVLKIKAPKK